MDNNRNETIDLSLQGTAIRSTMNSSSRPSSARHNAQSTTPSREGNAKENQINMNTSVNFSSARKRRHSSSSQRSFGLTSPPVPADTKQAIPLPASTSSVFRALSPQQHDVDGFFTDQSQQKSDDSETEETRRWVDEIYQLNAPIISQEPQQYRDVAGLGMSKDSLNGTVTATNFHDELPLPTKQSMNVVPKLEEEASIKIQRWYRKNSLRTNGNNSQQLQLPKKLQHSQEYESNSRPPSVANSTTKHPRTPVCSPRETNDNRTPSRPISRQSLRANNNVHELSISVQSPRVDRSTFENNATNNSKPSSRRPSFTSITPKASRSPIQSPRVDNVNNSNKSSSRRPSFTSVTPKASRSPVQSIQVDSSIIPTRQSSRRSSTSSISGKPLPSPREILQQRNDNNSRASSRRSSTASSISKQPKTPVPSPLPPTIKTDEKPSVVSSIASTSRVILDEVYETLKKLEEVEQFPTQPPLEEDSVYLTNPRDVSSSESPERDEINPYDSIVESVHSQKLTKRETPSPNLPRFTPPPQSTRRHQQQPIKVTQSAFVPFTRTSDSYQQQPQSRSANDYSLVSEQDFDYQLQKQKVEYEAIIQRHLKFIDQLIDDKKKLSSRCELLVSELRTIDRKCNDRIRSIEEAHRTEIQKLKDVHESAERIRRDQWIEEKTKKIKELTVRGLEPEIQKLIGKHKNEIAKIRAVHQAELLASDERASQRYIRMVEELRDQLEREKEVAIAQEREMAREKYEKSLRDEEKSFSDQRRRLYAEIEDEKSRQAELITRQRADLDKLRRDIEDNHRQVVETTKREYEGIRLEQERRHTNEVNELKEKFNVEKENWQENYLKQQETLFASKERQLREQMRQERDREIEKIINQLESDTTATKEEAEQAAETRIKRIREKYESDFRELETSEQQAKERLNQIRAQLTEIQGEKDRLETILKQKETEIEDIKKITDTLQKERERLSDIIRQEFADRLVTTDDENRRIKNEIAELRARQQLELDKKKEELENLRKQQEKELETIHEKIKQAITKKDEQVQNLRVQYETAVKRAEHFENLLAQQRKVLAARPATKKT